ncbi:hypothetical protein PaeCFBP13512_22355 [Paenibacillus sp. CFBP13512]|uniref:hypothetical protein n=1 Tax=Paenibacillus sp. CFBP13512 TaxID=2184007 RepID=UPI0010BFA54B|nr:hypothetical protein [Paenibacillus sp. CFBP13512]TKJ83761.1 hypothetical protein PaeCFBP13512_22355 [Paenibacillus sp. CFBP13512]
MKALNFTLSLFKKYNMDFKLSEAQQDDLHKATIIKVSHQDVQRGHIESYLKKIHSLEKKKKNTVTTLIIIFEGYEDVNLKIFNVPELKQWIRKLYIVKPNLFYYLRNHSDHYVHDILMCLVEANPSFLPTQFKKYANPSLLVHGADAIPTIEKIADKLVQFSIKRKHSSQEIFSIVINFLAATEYEGHVEGNKIRLEY